MELVFLFAGGKIWDATCHIQPFFQGHYFKLTFPPVIPF